MNKNIFAREALAFGFSCFIVIVAYFTLSYFKHEKINEMNTLDREAISIKSALDTLPNISVSFKDISSITNANKRSELELRRAEIPVKQFEILNSFWINHRTEDLMVWVVFILIAANGARFLYHNVKEQEDAN